MRSVLSLLKKFARDTRGSVSVEFVLVAPFLFWALMATYAYFDGYRQSTINLKATYTISDLISRETMEINDDYIDSMFELFELMTRPRSLVKLRISIIRYDEDDGRYYVDWSANRGYLEPRTNSNITSIHNQLPTMPDNERVILVESRNFYVPRFKIGMGNADLYNFVFTRPRFAPQVVWSDS